MHIKCYVQFSHSVISDSLKPHGLQHARPPCPLLTPGACSNSRPLSQWCCPTISSSIVPFSSHHHLSLHQGLFQSVHLKGNQSWIFIVRNDAEAETPILMQRADSLEKTLILGVREGNNRGWDGWVASLTQWTWVWASSGSWWCTGKPGLLQSMESQTVGHDWVIELNWIEQRWHRG